MKTLVIRNLHVNVEEKEILKGIDLEVKGNEVHALMGPNGNGKSTLLAAIMGHPKYIVTEGSITYDDKDVLRLSVDERSKLGLFLAMQYPQEIPGVTNSDFLRAAINVRQDKPVSLFRFIKDMEHTIEELQMKPDLAHRFLNEGFSGGEKKRNEIVQMEMLKPSFAMLDEIDSGLDVDALKIVGDAVNRMQKERAMSLIVVSHYDRFYEYIQPHYAHVLINGRIVLEGERDIVTRINEEGYDWIYRDYHIDPPLKQAEEKPRLSLGTCAVNKGVTPQ